MVVRPTGGNIRSSSSSVNRPCVGDDSDSRASDVRAAGRGGAEVGPTGNATKWPLVPGEYRSRGAVAVHTAPSRRLSRGSQESQVSSPGSVGAARTRHSDPEVRFEGSSSAEKWVASSASRYRSEETGTPEGEAPRGEEGRDAGRFPSTTTEAISAPVPTARKASGVYPPTVGERSRRSARPTANVPKPIDGRRNGRTDGTVRAGGDGRRAE